MPAVPQFLHQLLENINTHFPEFSSVQFSHSVMSDSLWPHESQHARPPCPSPTPGVHLDSRPSSQWCHPAISSSVIPFSSCPQSLPASESFPMRQLFAWGGQSTGVSAFEHCLTSKWIKPNCAVVWTTNFWHCLSLRLEWKHLFQSCGHCWVVQNCWHIECSTFTASSFKIWNSSTGIPLPPLALFVVMLLKTHLTSHSRLSGSKWVITPSWLSGSWRSFVLLYILTTSS